MLCAITASEWETEFGIWCGAVKWHHFMPSFSPEWTFMGSGTVLPHNSCQILRFSGGVGSQYNINVFFLLMIYGSVTVSLIFLGSWVGKWSLEHAKPLWLATVSLVPGERGFVGCSTQLTKGNSSQLALTKKSGVKISRGQICKPLTAEAKPRHVNGAAVWTSSFFQADKRIYTR